MVNVIYEKFADRIATGLNRKAIRTCSSWAESYRIMSKPFPGPWTFKHHPWLREMHDARSELWVGQKAAQMGYTETLLNKVFYEIDINQTDCLYALPTQKPDAADFSSARFDPALEMSKHLTNLFSDVKNVGHKRAHTANLYVRGSRARNALKSFPAGLIVLDEIEEFVQENIPLALERASGQIEKQICLVSTPSVHKFGINKYFLQTSQEHFFFECPHCNKLVELAFPESLVILGEDQHDPKVKESYLQCTACHGKLEHETKTQWLGTGRWVAKVANREERGFYINQMYSPAQSGRPAELVKAYFKAQFNQADEQEFYNSKLGLPHETKGSRITEAQIVDCTGEYVTKDFYNQNRVVTMGVDVGSWLHVEIDAWTIGPGGEDINTISKPKVIYQGKVKDFEELDKLMLRFYVSGCVIDAHPERRKALEFARRFYGNVKVCIYARGINGKTIKVHEDDDHIVLVDRTYWLDQSLGRFHKQEIVIPANTDLEYKEHLKAVVKIYEKDAQGNPIAKYISAGDDHYAHSRNYAEIALPLASRLGGTQNMESPV